MNKRIIANRFGLIALMSLSLFASTAAHAISQPVIVTNTTAQPVPVVGIVKDSDAPARKPYQTAVLYFPTQIGTNFKSLMTVPANQRLVIQHVSGICHYVNTISLASNTGLEFLPAANTLISIPVTFYANPGENFGFTTSASGSGYCNLTLTGYFVNLP